MPPKTSNFLLALLCAAPISLWAEPPTDPKARKIYDHDKEWLSKFPPPFVATNIRGQGMQYAERRQAALDLVKQQRDFGVVSELMLALKDNSFLSVQIIEILEDWKAKRALPLLKEISADAARPEDVRAKAVQAIATISNAKPDKPPVYTDSKSH